jgi:hypothetical protein
MKKIFELIPYGIVGMSAGVVLGFGLFGAAGVGVMNIACRMRSLQLRQLRT